MPEIISCRLLATSSYFSHCLWKMVWILCQKALVTANTITMNTMDSSVIFQLITNITTKDTIMVSSTENMSPNTSSIKPRIWFVSRDTRLRSSPGFRLLIKERERVCIL